MKMEASIERAIFVELRRLELLLMDPVVRRDREQVAGLLTEDFIEFGSSGRMWTRDSTLALLASETFEAPEVEGFACRMLAENVALVTYRAVQVKATGGRAVTLRSSVWMRESESWKICFHQGTPGS